MVRSVRGKTIQARFEVSAEADQFRKILVAPYGLRPTDFNLKHDGRAPQASIAIGARYEVLWYPPRALLTSRVFRRQYFARDE